MFKEEKLKAINLYKQTRTFAVTRRMLGYLKNDKTIRSWQRDFKKNKVFTNTYKRIERNYSKEEIDFACEYYLECKNIKQTITDIGYPKSRMTLWKWLKNNGTILTNRKKTLHYSDKEKRVFFV